MFAISPLNTKGSEMKSENFVDQELFKGYNSSNPTHQINLKIKESDLRLIDEKARRYGLTRSALIKLFVLNGELSINIDRNDLQKPIT
jgi:hypothetical protein